MPNKTKTSRKRRGQKGKSSRALTGLTDVTIGLPDRLHTTMTYGTYQILAPGASGTSSYSFRGNSVYDPDFTGTGTTAFPYSKLSAMYNRYRVMSAKIFVEGINTGTTALTFYLTASVENAPVATERQLGGRHTARGTTSPTGINFWDHTAFATTAKIFGVPNSQVMSEDDFAGLIGGNPNNAWYYHIMAFNNNAGTAGAAWLNVRIEYDVWWSMPLNLNA